MLAVRNGSVSANGGKMTRPPPVPPRPDKSLVADALAKSRKVPAPVLPPGLKREFAKKDPPSPNGDAPAKPNGNRLPSPKLNGLSRVKSFIRDVINDKKHSDDKKGTLNKNKETEAESAKNGIAKSQIPLPHAPPAKGKGSDANLNYPTEESVKNQSSQSVVRSLYSVLITSDKVKSPAVESNAKTSDKVTVVKSNSFAEKAIPVRRAPPPPISPKPTKKQIEDKLSRIQNATENFSMRKLSASCEELNNSSSRPIVYQSPSPKVPSSPLFAKKVPPSLPSGKPPVIKKKGNLGSPNESESNPIRSFLFIKNTKSYQKRSDDKVVTPVVTEHKDVFTDKSLEKDTACATEKLISEIISAKNEALVSQFMNGIHSKDEPEENASRTPAANSEVSEEDISCNIIDNRTTNLIPQVVSSQNDDRVNCVSISYSENSPKPNDSVSLCSSDGSSSAGKTVLFINSEMFSDVPKPLAASHGSSPDGTVRSRGSPSGKRFDDIANHELLISELQDMRKDAMEERVNRRQRQPSLELAPSSPDSISAETQNIQHSDWMQVEDNGLQVRYSSCQIVIEDSLPVDDSGICLDDNFYTPESAPYSLSPSLVSRLKEQFTLNQKMSSLQGLPPLPKSLSGFNVADSGPPPPPPPARANAPPPVPARSANSFRYSNCASPGSPGSRGGSSSPPTPSSGSSGRPAPAPIPASALALARHGSSSSSSETQRHPRKLTTLDTQLAVLKREMLSLRQLDLSLLSQLWSLNESIHEFRQYMGERGPGGGPGDGLEDEDDEDGDGDDSSSGDEAPRRPAPPAVAIRGRTPV